MLRNPAQTWKPSLVCLRWSKKRQWTFLVEAQQLVRSSGLQANRIFSLHLVQTDKLPLWPAHLFIRAALMHRLNHTNVIKWSQRWKVKQLKWRYDYYQAILYHKKTIDWSNTDTGTSAFAWSSHCIKHLQNKGHLLCTHVANRQAVSRFI